MLWLRLVYILSLVVLVALFGLVSPFGPDPKALFRAHANRLKNAGL